MALRLNSCWKIIPYLGIHDNSPIIYSRLRHNQTVGHRIGCLRQKDRGWEILGWCYLWYCHWLSVPISLCQWFVLEFRNNRANTLHCRLFLWQPESQLHKALVGWPKPIPEGHWDTSQRLRPLPQGPFIIRNEVTSADLVLFSCCTTRMSSRMDERDYRNTWDWCKADQTSKSSL